MREKPTGSLGLSLGSRDVGDVDERRGWRRLAGEPAANQRGRKCSLGQPAPRSMSGHTAREEHSS